MKIETNKEFDCYDVTEMSGINRGITIDGKTLEEIKADVRAKTLDELPKVLFANKVIDKSVIRRVIEQMKEHG